MEGTIHILCMHCGGIGFRRFCPNGAYGGGGLDWMCKYEKIYIEVSFLIFKAMPSRLPAIGQAMCGWLGINDLVDKESTVIKALVCPSKSRGLEGGTEGGREQYPPSIVGSVYRCIKQGGGKLICMYAWGSTKCTGCNRVSGSENMTFVHK